MQSWGSFEPVPNSLAVEPRQAGKGPRQPPSDDRSSQWIEPPSHGRPPPVNVEKAHPTEEELREIMKHKNYETMPKRLKMMQKGFRHMENQRMHKEDRFSDLRGALE